MQISMQTGDDANACASGIQDIVFVVVALSLPLLVVFVAFCDIEFGIPFRGTNTHSSIKINLS